MATSDILNALSSSGLGTGQGIDVTATVSQLIANLRGPEQVWQTQQKLLQGQSSALTQLNTEVTALSNTVDSLNDPAGALTARSVTSSEPAVATATASNSTPVGSHTVVVNNLATSSSYYSGAVASSATTLAAGSFTIQVGSQPATTITIDATNNTLDGLAAAITNANLGVTASVVNDSNGARLAIVSNTSGAASDLTVTFVDLRFRPFASSHNLAAPVCIRRPGTERRRLCSDVGEGRRRIANRQDSSDLGCECRL